MDLFWFDLCIMKLWSFHKLLLVFNGVLVENDYQRLLSKESNFHSVSAAIFCGMKTRGLIFNGISEVSAGGKVSLIFSALFYLGICFIF